MKIPRAARRAGFVLTGGASSRMGHDKALLPYGAVRLVEHVAAQVAAAAGSVTLAGHAERYRGLGFEVIDDLEPGLGPLGGILTVLRMSKSSWNLIVACDMPSLDAGFLRGLLTAAEQCGGDCLVPVSPSGRLEPLCAVYHLDALARLERAREAGVRALRDAAAGPGMVQWKVDDASRFANLNTAEDLARHSRTPAVRA